MAEQKEFQGAPRHHPPVRLEPRLLLKPSEVAIEPCHEGQREPHIDNGRRLPWRAADTALWRRCCLEWGRLLGLHYHHPALRWGHTFLLCREGHIFYFTT